MIDASYVLAGAITGFLVGLTGVGGGAVMTPVLLVFFGVAPDVAIATDLWFAAITKMVGARVHQTKGAVDWRAVKLLWFGSLPAAIIIVLLVSFSEPIRKIDWLTHAIGMLVLVTAIGLLLSPMLRRIAHNRRVAEPIRFKAVQPALTIGAGGVLGCCVALTSIGAGALGSVMLLYLYPLRMTPQRLVATDLVHAIPLAIVAGLGYLIVGQVDGRMLVNLLLGSLPAVVLGSQLAGRLSERSLQVALAVILLVAGAKVLI